MRDMRGHHFGDKAGPRLHLGQFPLGLFQCGIGRGKFAVGLGQTLCMAQKLAR